MFIPPSGEDIFRRTEVYLVVRELLLSPCKVMFIVSDHAALV